MGAAGAARGFGKPWNGRPRTRGGVAERSKAAVLKTAVRKHRGFESLLLRWTPGRTGEMAEWSKAPAC